MLQKIFYFNLSKATNSQIVCKKNDIQLNSIIYKIRFLRVFHGVLNFN